MRRGDAAAVRCRGHDSHRDHVSWSAGGDAAAMRRAAATTECGLPGFTQLCYDLARELDQCSFASAPLDVVGERPQYPAELPHQ